MLRLLPASFVGVYPPYVGSKRNVVPLRIVVESESLGRASVGAVFPCALCRAAIALTIGSVQAYAAEQICLHLWFSPGNFFPSRDTFRRDPFWVRLNVKNGIFLERHPQQVIFLPLRKLNTTNFLLQYSSRKEAHP